MKRNTKPFSVEIKKSRVQDQRHQLPPRRLFATIPIEAAKIFQKEEPEAVIEPAAPRILPSILQSAPTCSEPDQPARRNRSPGLKDDPEQIEFDLNATTSDGVEGAPAETSAISEAMSRIDTTPVAEGDAARIDKGQPWEAESPKPRSRKVRKKTPEAVDPALVSTPVSSQLGVILEAGAIEASPEVIGGKARPCRLSKRQAAAAQLPRYERWKRRLHPAAW